MESEVNILLLINIINMLSLVEGVMVDYHTRKNKYHPRYICWWIICTGITHPLISFDTDMI